MDSLKEFRTYRRRDVTRTSGFKTNGVTTGGQCKIKLSSRVITKDGSLVIKYSFKRMELVELFKRGIALLCFGMYLLPEKEATIEYILKYRFSGKSFSKKIKEHNEMNPGIFNSCGFYEEIKISKEKCISDVSLNVHIKTEKNSGVHIICDDFAFSSYEYFVNNDAYPDFLKKTSLNVPHIFYLKSDNEPLTLCTNKKELTIEDGQVVVLKSCNRCGRYLPINIDSEANTLAYALHCKKRAPCHHANFYNYEIVENDVEGYEKEKDGFIYSYYGHQLECKACKKFFVNAPLNPQRNAQQFKEDGLRRRAFEVLVDNLLEKDLIHHEFKKRTSKEFTQFIYDKFDGKCFKCGKKLTINEMNLDHTMPLAYLYRLDETATCLCDSHNSSKNDHFPCEFYTEDELVRLSKITGLDLNILKSKSVNMKVVDLLKKNVVWFFDVFLADPDYQKIRDDRLTADKIYAALVKVLPKDIDLVRLYSKETGHMPKTITIK